VREREKVQELQEAVLLGRSVAEEGGRVFGAEGVVLGGGHDRGGGREFFGGFGFEGCCC